MEGGHCGVWHRGPRGVCSASSASRTEGIAGECTGQPCPWSPPSIRRPIAGVNDFLLFMPMTNCC